MSTDTAILTPEMHERLQGLLDDLFGDWITPPPAGLFADMAHKHGVGLVDTSRSTFLVDARVHEAVAHGLGQALDRLAQTVGGGALELLLHGVFGDGQQQGVASGEVVGQVALTDAGRRGDARLGECCQALLVEQGHPGIEEAGADGHG